MALFLGRRTYGQIRRELVPRGGWVALLRFGHRDPGFTLRIYVHLMPDAADRMCAVVDNAMSPPADVPAASPPPFS
jgi:hypothetical protein